MGKRGVPPKPTAIKVLEGNPGNRPLPTNEPEFETLPGVLPPPEYLDETAAEEWQRMMPVLITCGLMTAGDLVAFEIYCSAYSRWRKAEAELKKAPNLSLLKTPNGHVQANPWMTISRQCAELVKSYLIEFGLTPAARARMGAAEPQRPGAPGEPLQAPKIGGRFSHLIGKQGGEKPN